MTSGSDYPERPNGEIIRLGMAGRCPRCARGRMFKSRFEIADKCNVCGLVLSEHDAGDVAVVPALLVIGSVLVGLALWVEFKFEPAIWVHIVLWTPLTLAMTMILVPKLKGIGVALQHKHRSTEQPTDPGGS